MKLFIIKNFILIMLFNYNLDAVVFASEITFPVQIKYHTEDNKISIIFDNKLKREVFFNRYESGYNGKLYNNILNVYCGSKKIKYIGPTTDFLHLQKNNIKLNAHATISFSFKWSLFYDIAKCTNNKLNIQYEYYDYNKRLKKTIHFKSKIIEIVNIRQQKIEGVM